MIETVFVFAFITALFESVILLKISPRRRLRILGSPGWVIAIHTIAIVINMAIHFGTVVGTMTAVTAGLTSFATVPFIRWVCGSIEHDRWYTPGLIKYTKEQLS